jgi:hypothetical protein
MLDTHVLGSPVIPPESGSNVVTDCETTRSSGFTSSASDAAGLDRSCEMISFEPVNEQMSSVPTNRDMIVNDSSSVENEPETSLIRGVIASPTIGVALKTALT